MTTLDRRQSNRFWFDPKFLLQQIDRFPAANPFRMKSDASWNNRRIPKANEIADSIWNGSIRVSYHCKIKLNRASRINSH